MIAEKDMVERCARVLQEVPTVERVAVAREQEKPGGAPGRAGYRADAMLELFLRGGPALRLLVEAKPAAALRHAMEYVHPLLASAARECDAHPVFFTDQAGPTLAEQLASRGMDFVDMAGNMRLNMPGLYLEVSGRRSPSARPARGALWTPAALRLVHLLLMRPDLASRPQRKLAELAGIAHGGVSALLAGLEQAGHVIRTGRREFRLTNPQGLYLKWLDGYGQRLRRALLLGTYMRAGGLADLAQSVRTLNAKGGREVILGGELVAQRLVGELLRPMSAAVYLPAGMEKKQLLSTFRLMPDPQGNISILQSFFPAELCLPAALLGETDLRGVPCASALAIQGELALIPDSRVAKLRETFSLKILEPSFHAAASH